MAMNPLQRLARALGKGPAPSGTKGSPEVDAFDHLLDLAEQIAATQPQALHAFVVAILRPLQSEQILQAAERNEHAAREEIDELVFFMGRAGSNLFSVSALKSLDPSAYEVDLARDLTLPTTWVRDSIVRALGEIGPGMRRGAWRQHPHHLVSLWLPWRIAFVHGGNHSIAAGVLRAEGKLRPSSVFDLVPVLNAVRCDGENYIRVADGHLIAPVPDHRIGAVWEIGRLMAGLRSISKRAG